MSIKDPHPLYTAMLSRWTLGCDSYDGGEAIKDAGKTYLPATSGQLADGESGADEYAAYKMRAVYPDAYKEAVEAATGVMHREPPTIVLPEALEPMRNNSTVLNESLEALLRNINVRQLTTGRVGVLGDIVAGEVTRPVIAIYNELAVINWDDTLSAKDSADLKMVVLDESGYEFDGEQWTHVEKHRVLGLTDGGGEMTEAGTYGSGVISEGGDTAQLEAPALSGKTLNEIPFAFANSKDVAPTPDIPPLDGLARLCLTIYRGEADYRQSLFAQGQDTLVLTGANIDDDERVRTGAGARLDVQTGGDAKYIGVSSLGLPEQRTALENDYARATQKSGQLLDSTGKARESGDALRIRVAAQTATLTQIAKTGAAALEKVLKSLATWYGANPDDVSVTPNLNFSEHKINGQTLVQIVQAKALGAPISDKSIHAWQQDHGLTSMTLDDELAEIEQEAPMPGADIGSPVDQ